jgi:uncharacterized protein DUF4349
MSQRDLVAELRGSRVSAPLEVRERVRLIVASASPPPRRRLTWRRALVVALPVAAAVAASIVFTRPSHDNVTAAQATRSAGEGALRVQHGAAAKIAPHASDSAKTFVAPTAAGRAVRYGAYLALRVPTPDGVSEGVKRALRITSSVGGYPTSVHASSKQHAASADLILKVPRRHVQDAIQRLSALGTITGEQVDVEDVQAGVNATVRTIARLQRRLATLRAQAQTPSVQQQIETITGRIERLQRNEAATIRATRFATIQLHLQTPQAAAPHKHAAGPLHGLGVAFRWIGIGAIYALALGAPLALLIALGWLAARAVRRRREDALLSSP